MSALHELFDVPETQHVEKLEAYKSALRTSHAEAAAGKTHLDVTSKTLVKTAFSPARREEILANIDKSLSGDGAGGLAQDLADVRTYLQTEVNKDWTPSNPVGGTGLTPYDLEAPAKILVPLHTPLRNMLPRVKGQGNARKFKRIDSFTNAGIPGGAAQQSPFWNSLTGTASFNGLTLNRPPKISYTGSDHSVAYVTLGVSDQVDWVAQFQGLGFDDLRGLSHTASLYAHLMGEERAILFGRGSSGNGYEGSVSAPTVTSATGTGSSGSLTGTYYVYVTANTGFGESLPSTVVNTGALTNANSITVLIGTEPTGAILYNVYVGTTTGIANAHFQGTFSGNSIVLTAYNSSSAIAANTDTSYDANAYDGYLTVQSDPTVTGYFNRQNAPFSTTNPGSEFDTELQTMYVNNAADPDDIWMTGALRAEFGQLMRIGGTNGAASGYRTNVTTGDGSVTMGTAVTGYVNQNTGKVLDLHTHRFMLNGAALTTSRTVPIPLSNVSSPVQMVNVQDYMAVDWPTIQMTYDVSTWQVGTMEHVAPAWNGLIVGIQ